MRLESGNAEEKSESFKQVLLANPQERVLLLLPLFFRCIGYNLVFLNYFISLTLFD